tara:strand:- start:1076 stop:1672 length:597 start_codon:yes stop_codon:yes gene_type:complete
LDPSEIEAKKLQLICIAKRNFEQRLQTNNGGNLSIRLSSVSALIIKPSGIGFNECSIDNLMIVNLDGTIIDGHLKPSKDLDFHLDLYNVRPDINAIVHCHSPWATSCASAGEEIPCLTVQTKEKLGRIPLIPLSENGGPQTSKEISPILSDKSLNAAILANHGSIGLGKTLMTAQYVAELIEETAHIFCIKNILNNSI